MTKYDLPLKSLSRFFDHVFSPPYQYFPLIMVVYYGVYLIVHPYEALFTGQLIDPDDYMRLNEVINWLSGHSYYDLREPRMSPGAGTVINWSRLLDIPLALLILPLRHFYTTEVAALKAAMIVPPLTYLLLLGVLPRLMRPLLGRRQEKLVLLFIPFLPDVMVHFMPGKVDHHGCSILVATYAFSELQSMLIKAQKKVNGLIAALVMSIGLWIGMEIMPVLLLIFLSLSIGTISSGGVVQQNTARYTSYLALTSLLILPLAQPMGDWFHPKISWFSSGTVLFLALVALAFSLLSALSPSTWIRRLMVLSCGGLFGALFYLTLVPEVLRGPFANFDAFNRGQALELISEAQPYKTNIYSYYVLINMMAALSLVIGKCGLTACATALSFYGLRTPSPRLRRIWLSLFLTETVLLVGAVLLQKRVIYFAEIASLPAVAYGIVVLPKYAKGQAAHRASVALSLSIFLLCGPVVNYGSFYLLDLALRKDPQSSSLIDRRCDFEPVITYLVQEEAQSGIQHTILASMDEGPEILFRTKNRVVGGNFNAPGNQDVYEFFHTNSEEQAKDILKRWHADRVIICAKSLEEPTRFSGHDRSAYSSRSYMKSVLETSPPLWLTRVPLPQSLDYFVYNTPYQNPVE